MELPFMNPVAILQDHVLEGMPLFKTKSLY